jgi:polar amino acid transport system substrate-binding protein
MSVAHRRYKSAAALAISATVLVAGCADTSSPTGSPGSSAADPLKQYKDNGSLQLGVASEPPYSYLAPDGSVAGIDAEVAATVFKNLGIPEIRGVQVPFSAMIPGLQAKRFDVLAGDLFMKQSRCALVNFSEPTTVVTYSFLVKADLGDRPSTVTDLVDKGLRVAVQAGTLQDAVAQKAGLSGKRLLQVPDGRSSVDALRTGRVDAVLDGRVALEALLPKGQTDLVVTETVPDMPVTGAGVAFRNEDVALHDAFDRELKKLKDSGGYSKISEKYKLDPEPVLRATKADLCKTEG